MDPSKIVQLRLLKKDYKDIPFKEPYAVRFVDKHNYRDHLSRLLRVTEMMVTDIQWIGIPDEDTLHKRFDQNSHCLIWEYNNQPIGWAWSNYNITIDWQEIYRKLPKGQIYGGGAFLSRKIKRPPNSGLIFYNLTFDYWLNKMNNDCILQYSDDWNRVSSIMSYKCGFKKFNFLWP